MSANRYPPSGLTKEHSEAQCESCGAWFCPARDGACPRQRRGRVLDVLRTPTPDCWNDLPVLEDRERSG